MRLNHLVQWLIQIVRDRIERPVKARYGVMRIHRIRVVRIADAESPRKSMRHLPGVLRIEVQIEEVVRVRIDQRKGLRGCGCDAVNELRKGGVGHQRDHTLTEIIVVQVEDPAIGSETEYERPHHTSEI